MDNSLPRFYPPDRPVPATLLTDAFLLEPLTPVHTALDHAALMESKQFLRRWSGSPWPADDFSLADNRADLAEHDEEHRRRVAFTYTVLAPDRSRCLGCVYIKPLAALAGGLPLTVGVDEATVRWWVTTPLLATDEGCPAAGSAADLVPGGLALAPGCLPHPGGAAAANGALPCRRATLSVCGQNAWPRQAA